MDIRESLTEHIRRADRSGAGRLIQEWASQRGAQNLLTEVLEPTLRDIGHDWLNDECFTLAQAYVTSKIAEDVMELVLREAPLCGEGNASHGPVVIGNIEEDFHALGRKLVGTFLRSRGWQVLDLGNDVPAKTFVDQAIASGAKVIGVSAMTLSTARNIAKLREEVDRRGLSQHLKIAVGGAVFVVRPGLVNEVGGDGTAQNALEAANLVEKLWKEALEHPRFA